MDDITEKLADAALAVPEILLPSKTIELAKWPVVACDQFTQERSFWDECAAGVGDAPSALHLVLPEVYMEDADCAARIAAIRRNMARYLQHGDGDVFDWPRNAGVFVERETRHGVRRGLVIAVDLEKYDWRGGSTSMIRASEDTIQERLPPRMEIRRGAPLEIPHVILLINDEENMLFSLLEKLMRGAPYTYNIDLCAGAGNVKGRLVCRKTDWNFIAGYFTHAYRQACTAYGKERAFLFAVGDGNHSLATAKAVWNEFKKEHAARDSLLRHHPARWALVEIENIYDPALVFEPIHRLLTGVPEAVVLDCLKRLPGYSLTPLQSAAQAASLAAKGGAANRYGLITKDAAHLVYTTDTKIATVELDPLLDEALARQNAASGGAKIDYVHGDDALIAAVNKTPGAAGILLPPFSRKHLFKTISEKGPLPRKSFSMGEPLEKRFYLEARRLFDL